MFIMLFDCDSVGVRLVFFLLVMCLSFYVDNIFVWLVNIYLGEGIEWLLKESVVICLMIGFNDVNM